MQNLATFPFRGLISVLWCLIALTWQPGICAAAGSNDGVIAPSWPTPARNAVSACADVSSTDSKEIDASVIAVQLKRLNNRIEKEDWSGRDLSGQNFAGKILVQVSLKGTKLRGADLTEAIICNSNLTDADLSEAHLDRALIGGATELEGASLAGASARNIGIGDASGSIRIDGADLRGANTFCDDFPRCIANIVDFSSVTGADLRGAAIGYPLCCFSSDLGTAKLDGLITRLVFAFDGSHPLDIAQLAAGVSEAGHMTFVPAYGFSGQAPFEFSGQELRRLPHVLAQMRADSSHPSFDCSRARSSVEKSICSDPKLSSLDNALNWLWERADHNPEAKAAQAKWLGNRMTCPDALRTMVNVAPCIEFAYVERIKQLGGKTSRAMIGSARYTTDPPLQLPHGSAAALARKFLSARGYREDEIEIDNLGDGNGKFLGEVKSVNYHQCSLESTEAEAPRMGSVFRFGFNSSSQDGDYISFVVTPYVMVMADGNFQFQCGARASWSGVYFRQPDDLIYEIKGRLERP